MATASTGEIVRVYSAGWNTCLAAQRNMLDLSVYGLGDSYVNGANAVLFSMVPYYPPSRRTYSHNTFSYHADPTNNPFSRKTLSNTHDIIIYRHLPVLVLQYTHCGPALHRFVVLKLVANPENVELVLYVTSLIIFKKS